MANFKTLLCTLLLVGSAFAASPLFPVYYDTTLTAKPSLQEIIQKTGHKSFTLAFALGSNAGCVPNWGAQFPIDDPAILGPIKAAQQQGAEFVVATGGAAGPYLEHLCLTVESLVAAYKQVLDVVGTTHLDVDVEATINLDVMNKALAQVQRERPEVSVSFTLMVQGDDYGVVDSIGLAVLRSAKANGVRVDIVNAMAMEYPSRLEWGDSVIATGNSVLAQMKEIFTDKTEAQLKKMLGITPMIGRNMSGRIFELSHARQVVEWANANHIGLLSFWSAARDNGGCPSGGVSPSCSSIAQDEFEFIKIFQGFRG
jgi:chitinase